MEKVLEAVTVKAAAETKVRSWSFGEVRKPSTINFRTLRAEEGGLFCCQVFGPQKDYECQCGRYTLLRHRGIICERCSVEVTSSQTRRKRLGHLYLTVPVSHLWFFRASPLVLGAVLSISNSEVERLLYYEAQVVVNSPILRLPPLSIISYEDFTNRIRNLLTKPEVKEGADAIKLLVRAANLEKLRLSLEEGLELSTNSNQSGVKSLERLGILRSLQEFEVEPDWFLPEVLPILPPELRPMIQLEAGKFAAADLNDLYSKVINRNNRLRRLLKLRAPMVVVRNEKKMLQEAVDCLVDNGRNGRTSVRAGKRPLKSLTEMLRGKTGRFRQNLLGKRVDYSGRAVITVGPELRLHQCGIPGRVFGELFRPFLLARGAVLRNLPQKSQREVRPDQLEEELWKSVSKECPILLNRAPTLHRLGFQAFEPVAVGGKAIRLNPLVCSAFNADFDGDQMAIHLPLSLEARLEAKMLMLTAGNLLLPTNGRPAFLPTQESVLGLYFSSRKWKGRHRSTSVTELRELVKASGIGNLQLNDNVVVKIGERVRLRSRPQTVVRTYWTTVGRCLVGRTIPFGLTFGPFNCTLRKGELAGLVSLALNRCKVSDVSNLIERLVTQGFEFATEAGMSLSIADFCVPEAKDSIVKNSLECTARNSWDTTSPTQKERSESNVSLWFRVTDTIRAAMLEALCRRWQVSRRLGAVPNPVYMMVDSGARGSEEQVRQIAGMRGLMVRPDGSILETPIISNFREGLTSLQYFISAHGARKGLADTALKTANSGYLTRRLADVSHDLIICEHDCRTVSGIRLDKLSFSAKGFLTAAKNSFGRSLLRTKSPTFDGPIENGSWEELLGSESPTFAVRSPVTCQSVRGLCSKCYGTDVSTGIPVSIGEAVGIIAAQSIGEPGTQLTMRTFHIGGTASSASKREGRHQPLGHILFCSRLRTTRNRRGQVVAVSESGTLVIRDRAGRSATILSVPCGTILAVSNYANIGLKDTLFWHHRTRSPIISEVTGTTQLGCGPDSSGLSIWNGNQLKAASPLGTGTEVEVGINLNLTAGQILGHQPLASVESKDITGGLLLVADIFETRVGRVAEILSEATGILTIQSGAGKVTLTIIGPNTCQQQSKTEFGRQLAVQANQLVRRGDTLVRGSPDLHGTLSFRGIGPLVRSVTDAVQMTYETQNIEINNKHIEVVIRQMLRHLTIQSGGGTNFFRGEQVERSEMVTANLRMSQSGRQLAAGRPILMGITRSALSTRSFISAASFQETSRILARAASLGGRDRLCGLKENVIVGRIVPAGTGFVFHQSRKGNANDQPASAKR